MFSRARLRRFNEGNDNIPGVGSYNIGDQNAADKNQRLQKLNQTTLHLKDKAHVANIRGELPKHVEDLHQRLKASEEKIIDLDILKISADKERDILQAEISNLKDQLKRSTDEILMLKTQQSAEVTSLSEKLQQEKKRFNSMISEMYGKTLAFEELKTVKQSLDEELNRLKDENQRALLEQNEARERHKLEIKELVGIQKENGDLEEKLKRAYLELNEVKQQHKDVMENFGAIQEKNVNLDEKLASLSLELSNTKIQCEELEDALRRKEEEFRQVDAQNNDKMRVFQAELQSGFKDNEDLRVKLERADLELSDEREKYNGKIEELNAAQKKIVELEEELNKANLELYDERKNYNGIIEQLHVAQEELHAAQKKNEELEEKLNRTDLVLNDKREKLHAAQKEVVELEEKLNKADLELNEEREKYNGKIEELHAAQKRNVELDERLNRVELELNDKREKCNSKIEELHAAQRKNVELEERLNSVCVELSDIKKQMEVQEEKLSLRRRESEKKDAKNKEKVHVLRMNLDCAYKGNEDLRNKLESAYLESSNMEQSHKAEMKETERKMSELQANLDLALNEIEHLRDQVRSAHSKQESCDQDESWRQKYEDLERRMEPFREIIEAYEVERKLIQEKDKYTQEQIEKLQQEAIKNMGHQNHKQKVKYVNALKQENVTLHQKFQESQEEVYRQTALVRKYKQKLEILEGSKSSSMKADIKPKLPLKEGNR